VAVSGGAGIYIRSAIKALSRYANVTLIGEAGPAYPEEDAAIRHSSLPARPVLPAYEGASAASFLVNAFLAAPRAWRLFCWLSRRKSELATYDAIVVTSSIDLLTLMIAKRVIPSLTGICFVQENAFLTGLRGRINRKLLREPQVNVSISHSWSANAGKYNIQSLVVANTFDNIEIEPTPDTQSHYDFVYVGGGARNKGFSHFLAVIEHISKDRSIKASLLGHLSGPQKARADAAGHKLELIGSQLDCPGFVSDVSHYLRDARVLLLPITEPHFCRPAIEAGLCERTFIVSKLSQLEDFATANYNCVMVDRGDVIMWSEACLRLLTDDALRHKLARSNLKFAKRDFSSSAFDEGMRKIIAAC
tara:strand:+ start:652 stop:1737 length:1086 start_codon:yes stop_codon:yes gene_type:complete